MLGRSLRTIFAFPRTTACFHEGPKLHHSDWVTRYVIAWQRDPVPGLFVVIGHPVPLRTPHPEHPSRDLYKPQQWLVRQIPGIRPKTRITDVSQGIAGLYAIHGWQRIVLQRAYQPGVDTLDFGAIALGD